MRRRDFIGGSAAALAAGGLLTPRSARAATWGTAPAESAAMLLGEGVRAESVLEVFMYGGLGPFESFYVVEDYGRPTDPDYPDQQWWLFANDHNRVYGGQCAVPRDQWLAPFGFDALGAQVNLGPVVWPLRQRADILSRMRIVVTRHDLEPHEAAIPYMLSGMRLGNVRMTGLGAHVQRYFLENRTVPGRIAPYSYVLTPSNILSTDNLRAASATGLHPGAARPLSLTISSRDNLAELLARGHLTAETRPKVDALLGYYRDAADLRHSIPGGERLRSRALDDHGFAIGSVLTAPELAVILGNGWLSPEGHAACDQSEDLDYVRVGIRAAAQLFNHPTDPARYINVIDTGLELADGGGGYDTHFDHLYPQARNATSLFQDLADHVNEPGEGDSTKIDLDKTMILLTTEFGRTPFAQELFGRPGDGTNHHPYGFVSVMIGGPIGPDQAGIVGAIGPDGSSSDYVSPSELRAASLAAMGIYPFTHESFAVGDIRDVGTERDGLAWVTEQVLGRAV
ncbi:MAG: DUF1501 domain-containing protein [Myxococcota bacterium]